ncbi:MAG: AraC family transcriptional regulator [Candidatus Delongbacteria bacterium]|nr:AraC family transcriptional regulator [Candidatus Delongbacteria bacterium]
MFHKITDEEFCNLVHEVLNEHLDIGTEFQIKFEEKFEKSYPMIRQRYKRTKKQTIKATHEELRFNYAKEKLKEFKCFEVMSDLGYKYESNFSKWFRKHAGMNPSEYQAKITSRNQNELPD